jgi:hypothetical protein
MKYLWGDAEEADNKNDNTSGSFSDIIPHDIPAICQLALPMKRPGKGWFVHAAISLKGGPLGHPTLERILKRRC